MIQEIGRSKATGSAVVAAIVVALVSFTLTAQAQESDPEAEIQAVVQQMVDAWNDGDAETFGALFTDDGIVSFVSGFGAPAGTTAEQARAMLPDVVGDPPIQLQGGELENASADSVTVIVSLMVGGASSNERVTFIQVDGEWKIDLYESNAVPAEVPEGYTEIQVDMFEYGYDFDPSGIGAGDGVAFQGQNTGEQPHEIVLIKVPADLDVQEALASEEPPADAEILGGVFAAPGGTTSPLIVESMAAGRYVIACFVPVEGDPDETPHWAEGMVAEFTVGAPVDDDDDNGDDDDDETPGPPSTGSAMSEDGGNSNVLLGLGASLIVVAAGSTFITRKMGRS